VNHSKSYDPDFPAQPEPTNSRSHASRRLLKLRPQFAIDYPDTVDSFGTILLVGDYSK
jgi:hypothetical protein